MKTILEMSKLAIDRFFDRYTEHSIHGTRTGLHYYFKVFDIFYLKEDLWGEGGCVALHYAVPILESTMQILSN